MVRCWLCTRLEKRSRSRFWKRRITSRLRIFCMIWRARTGHPNRGRMSSLAWRRGCSTRCSKVGGRGGCKAGVGEGAGTSAGADGRQDQQVSCSLSWGRSLARSRSGWGTHRLHGLLVHHLVSLRLRHALLDAAWTRREPRRLRSRGGSNLGCIGCLAPRRFDRRGPRCFRFGLHRCDGRRARRFRLAPRRRDRGRLRFLGLNARCLDCRLLGRLGLAPRRLARRSPLRLRLRMCLRRRRRRWCGRLLRRLQRRRLPGFLGRTLGCFCHSLRFLGCSLLRLEVGHDAAPLLRHRPASHNVVGRRGCGGVADGDRRRGGLRRTKSTSGGARGASGGSGAGRSISFA